MLKSLVVTKNKIKTILEHFWSLRGKNTKLVRKNNKKEHRKCPKLSNKLHLNIQTKLFQNDFEWYPRNLIYDITILVSRIVPEIHTGS